MEPFTPKGANLFNRFFTDDLLNTFFGGALVLLILTYLTSISNSLLYPTKSLNKRALDRYIIFSRISSFRGLTRLISGIEWPRRIISTAPQYSHSFAASYPEKRSIPHVRRKYSKLLVPCGMRILLLAAEFAAIYAGTSVTSFAAAGEGFDVTIPLTTPVLDTSSVNTTGCDDYLVPSRGQEQAGELLKCVFRTGEQLAVFQAADDNKSIALRFTPDHNSLLFEVRSREFQITRVHLQVVLNTIDGSSFQFGPVRPDLDLDKSTLLFDALIDGVLDELDHSQRDGIRSVEESFGDILIGYSQDIPFEQAAIADALVRHLRALPLSLNSTGPPWLYIDGNYVQRDDIRIAIIGLNRVAHGILLTVTIALAFFNMIVQHFIPAFTEVAYVASKSSIGGAVGVGPGAMNGMTGEAGGAAGLLRLQKFSDGETGHIGFRPSNPNQIPVDTFEGCEAVL